MKYLAIALLLVSFAFTVSGQTSLKVGSLAPIFTGSSMDGKNYDLSELRGSVVVLTFWSTRCEICRHENPKINQIVDKYAGKNVVFLALTMENAEKVEAYTQKNRLAAQILPDSFGVVLQYADRAKDGSIDMGFPSFFVIDKAGTIQYKSSGYNRTGALDTSIDRLSSK